MNNLLNKVNLIDSRLCNFAHTADLLRACKLSLCSGQNILLHGAGGFGKSEMVKSVCSVFAPCVKIFSKAFHVETTLSELLGGLNMRLLREEGREAYHLTNCLLDSNVAILEEVLDAPPQILMGLKTLFTERAWLTGKIRHPSQVHCAWGLTNMTPSEFSSMGKSENAFLERFPIRLEVIWELNATNITSMQNAVYGVKPPPVMEDVQKITLQDLDSVARSVNQVKISAPYLAKKSELCAKLAKDGFPLSPRTQMLADKAAQAAAWLEGKTEVELAHLRSLSFYVVDEKSKKEQFDKLFFQAVEYATAQERDKRAFEEIELFRQMYIESATKKAVFSDKKKELLLLRDEQQKFCNKEMLQENRQRQQQIVKKIVDEINYFWSNLLQS